MRTILASCSLAAFVIVASFKAADAAVIYVDDSASGVNNGSSWNDAFTDLGDGLKAAQPGDEVRIGQGMYKPAGVGGDRNATFLLPNAATIQGGYAGTGASDPDALDPQQFPTILSGDLNGDDGPDFANYAENSIHVVTADGVGPETHLAGFQISGGSAAVSADDYCPIACGGGLHCANEANPTLSMCVFEANQALRGGGALSAGSNLLHITDCTFRDNRTIIDPSNSGGAVLANGDFTNCVFENNRAGATFTIGGGGAVVGHGSFTNCQFIANTAGIGGAVAAGAPGVTTFIDCTFDQNFCEQGGAIAATGQGQIVVLKCTFASNTALSDFGGAIFNNGQSANIVNCKFRSNESYVGGGVSNMSEIEVANCDFTGNNAWQTGGAISNSGVANVVNCTIVGNRAEHPFSSSGYSGGIFNSGQLSVSNSVIWDNTAESTTDQNSQIFESPWSNPPKTTVNNSIVMDWDGSLGGQNNSGDDPLLVDGDGPDNVYGTDDDNPRLSEKSPAIDAGNNANLPSDSFDLDHDGDTIEPIPHDLDSNNRIVNEIVDLGAYEFGGEPVCTGDIAPEGGNGAVDVDDLLLVINNWGAAGGPADITRNGMVDVDDLLAVINNWGACE